MVNTAANAAACPANITISPLHSTKLYWDKKGSDNITGAYLGYQITNSSGADITSVSVATDIGTTSNLTVKRGGGQPAAESLGTIANGQSGYAYFLVDLKQGAGSQNVVTTLSYNSTSCTLSETLNTAPKRALAANANKIYSAEVVANVSGTDGSAPAIVKHGSYATVVVTGNTGTIGAGPDANREINLTPVVYPGLFSADAWKLVDVQFYSGSASCGSGGLISYRLHFSNATSPSSDNCGGLYSAAFTFQSRQLNKNTASEVQAFSYIASGNLIKHTSPFGSTISLPTVNNTSGTATAPPTVNLATTLSNAISTGAVDFTLDEVSFVAYQTETKTSNTQTFVGGTGPLTGLCLVNPADATDCGNGPYSVNNLKEDETLGTSVAGTFEIVTVNFERRIRFTASASYYIGGSNATDLPARIVVRGTDSTTPTPKTSDAFANASVLQGAAPTASGDTQSGPVNTPLGLTVTSSGSSITKCLFVDLPMPEPCSATTVTSNGTWTLDPTLNSVTFTPDTNYTGTTTVQFGVTDQSGATAYSELSATITAGAIFVLSFSANTGTGTPPGNISGNGNVPLPGKGALEKPGHQFVGWGESSSDTTALSSPYNLTQTRQLFAIWEAAPTLTFDGNSSTGGSVPGVIVGSGNKLLPANSGSLEKTGNAFGGWSIDGVTYQPGDSYNLLADKTALAVWIPEFRITFDGNNAETGSTPAQLVGNGSVNLPGNTGSLNRAGFSFIGWSTSNTATTALPTSYNLTADVTLFAVWQAIAQNNPPAPSILESDPCEPVAVASIDGEYVELGLIGVLSELFAAGVDFVSTSAAQLYALAMGSEFVSAVADNQVAMVNFDIDPDTYQSIVSGSSVFKIMAKAAPKQVTEEEQLKPTDVVVEPGSEPNSVSVSTTSGEPLELLSVQSIDLNLYAAFTGAELNNPAVWQGIGYGLQCWKLEPFSDTWFYLPVSAQPPGAPAGNWVYTNVIVKAGSITADPTTFQANTLFPAPNGGEMVWADVNGNGIYDPGGRTGDKAISHVVLCADLLTAATPSPTTSAPTSSPSPTGTVTPTPTITITPSPTATTETPTTTPTQTTSPTAEPTPTATVTPTPQGSPEPTQQPCSTPTVAPPSPAPTPTILIQILSTPTPSASPTPSEPGTTPTSPAPSPTETQSPEPTDTAAPTPTPTDSASPSPTPTGTAAPTPTESPSASPSPQPTQTTGPSPGPTATPAGPVPEPVFDPAPPTACEPSAEYGVAMKLTNGLSTSCFRMTTESFVGISSFGGFGFLVDEEPASATGELDELADTGFESSHWLVVALLLMALGSTLVVYARRRA